MALYEDIIQNTKKKNNNINKRYIRNQKLLNIIFMILLLSIIVSDALYSVKSNLLGIPRFSNIIIISALLFEIIIFLLLTILRFNFENKILKAIIILIFLSPLVAYAGMFKFNDGYNILFFVIRILLILSLIYIVKNKNKYTEIRHYVIRDIYYALFSIGFVVIALFFFLSNEKRRIEYTYNKELNGYELNEVLIGTEDVEIKDGTVKIDDNSLVNAGAKITIPESVKDVSKNAFTGSKIESITVKSKEINIMAALNNSNVKNVYLENADTKILDIDLANLNGIRFYTSKENIDAYRFNNDKYGYLFVPICEDDEYYVVYNGTNKKIEYFHKNDILESPSNFNANIDGRLKFIKWEYTNNETKEVTFPITIESNIELTAKWSQVYKFSFNYDDGNVVDSELFKDMPKELDICKEDGNLILPTLSKDNYQFDGWYDIALGENNLITSIKTEFFQDMSLKAKFSKKYKLSYHVNGGYIPLDELNQEYTEGDEIIPATPIKTGYKFIGWYLEPEFINKVDKVSIEGIELYAKYEAIAYNITYNTFGGENLNINNTYTIEDDYILSNAIKNGYEFKGWYSDSNYQNKVENLNGLYGDITLYAKYELVTYNIVFDVESSNQTTYTIETDRTLIDANKDGYRFIGWYNNENQKIENTLGLYGNLELFARFEIINYEILYVTDGINNNIIYTYNIETDYELIDSIREGYEFKGWYLEAQYINKVENTLGLHDKLVLYAKFEANKYYINYNSNGGNISNDIDEVLYDSNYELLIPTRLGYDFLGWFNNDIKFENGKWNLLDDINLIAKWQISSPLINMSEDVNKVYDGNYSELTIQLDHPLKDEYSLTIRWYKFGSDTILATNKNTITVKDSEESEYYCHLSISHKGNILELDTPHIKVNISKADYDLSNIVFNENQFEFEFNGEEQKPIINNLPIGLDGIELKASYSYNGSFTNVGDLGTAIAKFNTLSKNYNIPADMTSYVTIIPRTVNISFDQLKHTYDGLSWHPVGTITNQVNNYPVNLEYENIETINAGNHSIKISLDDNANYKLENEILEYEILKADYNLSNLTYNKTSFVYDGNYHIPEPTNLPVGLELDYENSTGLKDVIQNGMVTLKFNSTNPNYNSVDNVEVQIVIDPKEVKAIFDNNRLVYNGEILIPELSFDGVITGDSLEGVINNESINVGNYIANITLSSNNYIISSESDLSYEIIKADFDLSQMDFASQVFEYDGKVHIPTPINIPDGLEFDPAHSTGLKDVISKGKAVLKFESLNQNYNSIDSYEVEITINPKRINAQIDGANSFIYNKFVQIPNISFDGIVSGDSVNYIVNNESINVGNYILDVTIDNNNYVIDNLNELEYSITKASFDIEYTVEDVNFIYDGNNHHPSVSTIKKYTFDQNEIKYEFVDEFKNYGVHEAKIRFYATDNFEDVIVTKNVTIEKREIELQFNTLIHTYDNTLFIPEVTGYINVIDGDDVIANINNTDSIEAGSYDVEITLSGNDSINYIVNKNYQMHIYGSQITLDGFAINNYFGEYDGLKHTVSVSGLPEGVTAVFDKEYSDVCNGAQVNITFVSNDPNQGYNNKEIGYVTITQKNVEITYDTNTLTYNGEVQHPKASINGVVDGDIVNVIFETQSKNVSVYNDINVTLDNPNYKISSGSSLSYEIVARHVTLVWGNLELTYNRTIQKPTAIIKDNDEILDIPVLVTSDNNINVGIYNATAQVEDQNYIVEGSPDIQYSIIQRELELIWDNTALVYDGQNKKPQAEVFALVGDNVSVNVEVDGDHYEPGNYMAIASLTNSNYKILGNYIKNYHISKGSFDTEELDTKLLDTTTVTYDGNLKYPTVNNEKSYATDSSEIKYSYSSGYKNAGSYYVDITFYTDNDYYENYVKTVKLIINKLELDLSLDNNVFEYDNTIKKPNVTINNKVTGDDIIVNVTNTDVSIKNNIEVKMNITGTDSDNYKISKKYYYSIIKGNIDMSGITVSNTNVIYNGDYQLPTLSNLPEGVSIDLDNSTPVKYVSDTKATIVFKLSDSLSNNYNLPSNLSVDMVVNKKLLIITFTQTQFGYDGNKHKPFYELDQFDSDNKIELDLGEGYSEIGIYHWYVSELDVSNNTDALNYYIEETLVTLEILVGTFDMSGISFVNKEYTYDGNIHESIKITGTLPQGLSVSYSFDDESEDNPNAYKAVGEYSVTAIFRTNNLNYVTPGDLTAKIIIKPKTLQVSWSELSFVYDDNEHLPKASLSGIIDKEEVQFNVFGAGVEAGNYVATITNLSNSNYVLDIDTKSTSYVINKASYDLSSITFNNKTVSYNGLEQTIELTGLASVVGLDNSSLEVSIEGSRTVVGTTSVTATFTTDSNNYETPAQITRTLTITPKLIDVIIKLDGSVTTSRSFSKYYDGKPYNFTIEYNQNDLISGDDLEISIQNPTLVGTYNLSMEFSNENYSTSNSTISISINGSKYYGIVWDYNTGKTYPEATLRINGEYIHINGLGDGTNNIYYKFYQSNGSTLLDSAPTVSGTYQIEICSDYSGIVIESWNSKIKYKLVNNVIKWSYDGQYTSSSITSSGNVDTKAITYDGVEYASGLKLENNSGEINITVSDETTIYILVGNNGSVVSGKKVKIDGSSSQVSNSNGIIEVTLSQGTHIIKKDNPISVYMIYGGSVKVTQTW